MIWLSFMTLSVFIGMAGTALWNKYFGRGAKGDPEPASGERHHISDTRTDKSPLRMLRMLSQRYAN
jgi:hypothetical protein